MKQFMHSLAVSAGKILLKYFRTNVGVNYKSKNNPVTIADKQSEEKMMSMIRTKFPGDRFICEETCAVNGIEKPDSKSRYWIIDPLDGTVNFTHGVPIFTVSIALMEKQKLKYAMLYTPVNGDTYYAEKGKGAEKNGKRIHVSTRKNLADGLLGTGFPYTLFLKDPKQVLKLFDAFIVKGQGMRRLGSAALDLGYVAEGLFEGFWEHGLQPWDCAAGALMIEEAGGKVTDYRGGDNYLFGERIVGSNGFVHKKMIDIIRKSGVGR
ncbi:MAG: inositol monophosphatase family protein [Elusimicrobiota bacterium]